MVCVATDPDFIGAVEGLAADHSELCADRDAVIREVAQHRGVGVGDSRERRVLPGLQAGEALGGLFIDLQVMVWDRVAVRVDRGIAELACDDLDQLIGRGVRIAMSLHLVGSASRARPKRSALLARQLRTLAGEVSAAAHRQRRGHARNDEEDHLGVAQLHAQSRSVR
jgi:hypothetical protein